jgi:transcriptional regulator with XRE-family HTH domain
MSMSTVVSHGDAAAVATNVRRLMARDGLTFDEVVQATGLDERTLRGLVRGTNKPHARTLHKLATGWGISIDELFRRPTVSTQRSFDQATNPLIENVVDEHPDLFEAWTEAEFDELYSRFGTGGPLNEPGVLAAAEAMNDRRALLKQVCVVLESSESELLAEFVELLYRRVTAS